MRESSYFRLIYLTAGTLLPFFWMIVILGHRRQRNLERIFFFLCLALVSFFGSSLLALNAQLYYATPPHALLTFAWALLCLGLWFVPPLLVQVHVEYASLRDLVGNRTAKTIWLLCAWAPALLLAPKLLGALRLTEGVNFEAPSRHLSVEFQIWLALSVMATVFWQWKFYREARHEEERTLFGSLRWTFLFLAIFLLLLIFFQNRRGHGDASWLEPGFAYFVLAAFGTLIREVRRSNFLDIGRQRNLIYAVFMVFLALLYLSFVRRASLWWEHYLPPEATAALLLFLPVVFFEPLQRALGRLLRKTAQTEVDRAQKLMGPINEVARLGNQARLREFSERWVAEKLQLAEAHLSLDGEGQAPEVAQRRQDGAKETFEIQRGGRHLGSLSARSHGAMMSGETYAALEFLCEQLPGAFDLCRLIEEKLELERELAERQRLALVGQMAASISHNLKNPLGSIKTILQVQMESAELPASLRHETQMVLDEINRLSAKLNQLLQFSRPGVRAGGGGERCNLAQAAENVASVLRHEAETRGVVLEALTTKVELWAAASAEVANDILSNLVLNAIEATPAGGHVRIGLQAVGSDCQVTVEDDGAGISPGLKEKVLQPFFTTKPRGTGLGLAIVQRRLEELGGVLEWWSPKEDGVGTKFRITLPGMSSAEQQQIRGTTANGAGKPKK